MFDLILRYGTVVTPHGTSQQDVAISGETISAITSPGTIDDTQAKRVIDVNGKIVMPGCLLYTSPSPRDLSTSRMPSSA